jgi:hypothetical protein
MLVGDHAFADDELRGAHTDIDGQSSEVADERRFGDVVDLCVLTGQDGALPALEGRSFAPRIGHPGTITTAACSLRSRRGQNVSVTSGKLAERARNRWAAAGLEPITLHECRHTYASFLMAADYTLRELMEYMGHSSLQATERYVKLLPPLDETDPAERLNAYLRRRGASA